MSALFDQSYQPWTGTFQPHPFRVLAIATATAKNIFRRHTLALSLLGGLTMLMTLPGAFVGLMISGIDPGYIAASALSTSLTWTCLLVLPVAGSGLVASDLKHNALLMYFSKSIVRADYIVGKLAAAAVLVLLPAVLSPLVSIGVSTYALGDKATAAYGAQLSGAVLLSVPIAVIPAIALVMAFSSCTRKTFLAGIGFAVVYLMLEAIALILTDAAKLKWGYLLSLNRNVLKISASLMPEMPAGGARMPKMPGLDLHEMMPFSPWISLAILAGVSVLSLSVVVWRTADAERRA
ncbi:MAG: hypothetical protein HUU15_00575 [Candidatus Brocadiae bacterium]|nr:hypothetical protein [Candidatus Brocadiia bacterium]